MVTLVLTVSYGSSQCNSDTCALYLAVSFVSGCMAGATATILAFPFDVLKTRMIGQGEPKVSSLLHPSNCLSQNQFYRSIRTFIGLY